MDSSNCASTADSLDSLFMSLAISPDGKALKTGLFRSIAHGNLKLFAMGFEEEETESKFLRAFEAKEEGRRNEEVDENIISRHEIEEEETYKVDLEDIGGWVVYDGEDEEDLGGSVREWVDVVKEEKYEGEAEEGWVVTDGEKMTIWLTKTLDGLYMTEEEKIWWGKKPLK